MKHTLQIVFAVVILVGLVLGFAAYNTRSGSAYDHHQKAVAKQMSDEQKAFCEKLPSDADRQTAGCNQ